MRPVLHLRGRRHQRAEPAPLRDRRPLVPVPREGRTSTSTATASGRCTSRRAAATSRPDLRCGVYVERPHICRSFDNRTLRGERPRPRTRSPSGSPREFLEWLRANKPRVYAKIENGLRPAGAAPGSRRARSARCGDGPWRARRGAERWPRQAPRGRPDGQQVGLGDDEERERHARALRRGARVPRALRAPHAGRRRRATCGPPRSGASRC